jgi:hypothetical protein
VTIHIENHLQDIALVAPSNRRDDLSGLESDAVLTLFAPAEDEMCGKAVVLFQFEREINNELLLVKGQIIWVSHKHGQGWLVEEVHRIRRKTGT